MGNYNYQEAICEDIREYIEENGIRVTSNRDEVEEKLNDELWLEDSVTGNASGSYTCDAGTAEKYLCGNRDLLCEAIVEFGNDAESYKKAIESAEYADVTIRCYLLAGCISEVLDEIEEEDEDEEV